MTFACKKCKKVFRKDMDNYEPADEFCPNCDNHYVIEANERKGEMRIGVEGDDPRIMRDLRKKQQV
jgi:transposase